MPYLSILFGLGLIGLGLWGYITSDTKSITR